MKRNHRPAFSFVAALLLASAGLTTAMVNGYQLVGLGLHEETGRNIYLGALYLPQDNPKPADLESLSGPRIMEYRVVARRTSIRSLLGGMLLQSEVATGRPPSNATTEFADLLLSNIKSSLYAGDSLVIVTDGKSSTEAKLNGVEVARIQDSEVADYILLGWVSKSGPTTVFREGISAPEPDPQMYALLEANAYSVKRQEEVAAWIGPATEDTEPEPKPGPAAAQPEAITSPEKAVAATAVVAAEAAIDAEAIAPDSDSAEEIAASIDPATAPSESADSGSQTVAAIEPEPAIEIEAAIEQEIDAEIATPDSDSTTMDSAVAALDVQEYSRRLSVFHGGMVKLVYKEIKYPKRAVRRNLQGRLELDLLVTQSGDFVSVAISQPSGHKLLDDAALQAAKRAFSGGVPTIDPVAIAEFGYDTNTLMVPIPVSFKLAE